MTIQIGSVASIEKVIKDNFELYQHEIESIANTVVLNYNLSDISESDLVELIDNELNRS